MSDPGARPPAPTSERIWLCYLAAVGAVALLADGGGDARHDRVRFLALHAGILVVVLAVAAVARRGPAAARWWRVGLATLGLPVVFSALCWLLPAVHPEPYEYAFAALDRAAFGRDPGTLVDHLPPLANEVLQLCYAGFYLLCFAAAIGAGVRSGAAAFDRAVLWLVGGFLCSYLGYLLVPTLGPKVVLAFDREIEGLGLLAPLRAAIDAGEANPWDCFPSGHTMLTITSLLILWRWNRRWWCWLVLPGALLIASTVLLRYHWAIDVLVGAALAWPVARGCDRLADLDGWPVATPARSGGRPASAAVDRP
ncbi:MAG: phosphatase PAP2 family protein [Planctomycetes bacterium]|jgi:membrane-associated phospholipid phosphatase|nr:phosphatase PAP2 family protein [Planctomycetota bacterium]